MNTKLILDYLHELSLNNNRDWYHGHKDEYRKANAEFEGLVQNLISEIGKFDSSVLHNIAKILHSSLSGIHVSVMINRHIILRSGHTFHQWVSCRFL